MVERSRFAALSLSFSLAAVAAVAVLSGVVSASEQANAEPNNNSTSSEATCESERGYSVSKDGKLLLYHFSSAESTQDEARAIVSLPRDEIIKAISSRSKADDNDDDFNTVAVTATEQTKGRGTNGRNWIGARGNTFVTICIQQSAWKATSLPMTLLPVKIGIVVAEQVAQALAACHKNQQQGPTPSSNNVTIKWPNDVLVDGHKIAGVLIESTSDWFMIGIGINVAHAPAVPVSGLNHGRPSTCIRCHCPEDHNDNDNYVDLARQVGVAMANDLSQWLSRCSDTNRSWNANKEQELMLQQWRSFVDWNMQLVLRDSTDKKPVTAVDIEPDGRLRVKSQAGKERLVVSDYFL